MKPGEPLDVGVIGCGTAGPALAILLARAGHRVTVYERVPSPGPVGAGIMLQPTGQAALARLGLRDEVVDRGALVDRLYCRTSGGRKLLDIAYDVLSPELYGVGMHRGVIFESLFRALRREPIELRLGVAIEDLAAAEGGRKYVVDTDGNRHGPHSLIVVADGARSHLRDDTALRKNVREYAWGALWYVGPDEERRFERRLYQIVRGTGRLLGFLPTGLGPSAANRAPLVSLFWSLRRDRFDEWRRAGLEPWKREIRSYAPESDAFLDRITSVDQVAFTTYLDVKMSRWNAGNVVYIGDAAHAMSPQLGQGANLALFDAVVLAECIDEPRFGALSPGARIEAALDEYSRLRRSHLRYYQWVTRWLTPFFQSDYAVLGWLRDALMGPAARMPLVHREMVRSMAGVKLGILRGSMALPEPPKQLAARSAIGT